jgi:hypothetical protein
VKIKKISKNIKLPAFLLPAPAPCGAFRAEEDPEAARTLGETPGEQRDAVKAVESF